MPRNPHCVYEAANVDEADIVVAWLADRGIKSVVPDRETTRTLGLPNVVPGGVEVCVADEAQLAEATALVVEHEQALARHVAAASRTGTLSVVCDSCGKRFEVEAREAGHVVDCPHCSEYVDVPDPTASDVDYMEGAGDEGEEQ